MYTLRGVATLPPTELALVQKTVAGMKIPELRTGLRRLQVVADTSLAMPSGNHLCIEAGGHIFVANESIAGGRWAREVFQVDDLKFTVVPPEFVMAYEPPR